MRLHDGVKLLSGEGCGGLFDVLILGFGLFWLGRRLGESGLYLAEVVDLIPVVAVLLEFFEPAFDWRRDGVRNLVVKDDAFLKGGSYAV